MDKEKVRIIIHNMELLLDSLKSEIIDGSNIVKESKCVDSFTHHDYDEVFEDDYND